MSFDGIPKCISLRGSHQPTISCTFDFHFRILLLGLMTTGNIFTSGTSDIPVTVPEASPVSIPDT